MKYDDIWDWVDSCRSHQNADLRQLPKFHDRAFSIRETAPAEALSLYEQGRKMAETLNEPCWMLFFDFWCCEMYVFYLRDLKRAHDLAIRITVEASRPASKQCPMQVCIYDHLLSVYVYLDPVGYADKIRETLAFVAKQADPADKDTHFQILNNRAMLCHAQGDIDGEISYIHQTMMLIERRNFYKTICHRDLCYIYYYRDEFTLAQQHAVEGESCARRAEREEDVATMLAWQAVFARHDNDEERARQLYLQAVASMDRLNAPPIIHYPAALAAYHEVGGECDVALKVRQHELEQTINFGSPYLETETHLKICRLLGRMGKPFDEELAAARKSAEKLLNPTRFNQQVERLLNGDYSERLD